MNLSLEKTSDVSAILTVNVVEADYKEKVLKDLKEYGRNHTIPGFRKGHVPTSELQRRFGAMMTSDVINREVYHAVMDYIRENKLNVLGEPMPVDVKALDLKNEKDFTFQYKLALAPAIDLKLDKEFKMPYYTIEVTDKMVDDQTENFRKRFGSQVPGEAFEENALVKGALMELDADGKVKETEDAIQVISAIVMPQRFADKAQAEKFNGSKVGSKVVFNPAAAAGDDMAELASMLNIDREKAADVKSDFELAISEIIVLREAELGEELYTNVFGPDKVHDEKEWREAVKAMIARELAPNSDQMFQRDFMEKMMADYGKDLVLPVEILKEWLVSRNDNLNAENIDEEFAKMESGLRWQLIRDYIGEKAEVKVTEEDLLGYATMMARQQFAQYGMTNVDDETLADYAKRLIADKNYRRDIAERVADFKLFQAVKNMITLERKEVSLEEFGKLAQREEA